MLTRFAPSPTGALHLGNARTFLITHALATRAGGSAFLRMDDLETPRVKRGAEAQALQDLAWLGVEWVGKTICQSQRRALYDEALKRLRDAESIYDCSCTRTRVAQDSPGNADDGAAIYGGRCRGGGLAEFRSTARLRIDGDARWHDGFFGEQVYPASALGDIVVRRHDGSPSYQLASSTDDVELGVTHVIRGADLLASTARQVFIARALSIEERLPAFIHLPLVRGPDGRKLAKRHGDTRLAQLREEGVTAGQVRALLARLSGFEPSGEEIGVGEWVERFRLDKLPREDARYDDATDRPRPLK